MNILLCQINPHLGNLAYNAEKIISAYKANEQHSDLLVFPELALTGYPLHDLVTDRDFLNDVAIYIDTIATATKNSETAILFGAPYLYEGAIYNAALCARGGKISDIVFKRHLPNYGVFNEARNFTAANQQQIIEFKREKLGVLICEDIWFADTIKNYIEQEVSIVIAINASPYDINKHHMRKTKAHAIAQACQLPVIYVNQLGGQDDLVFDGGTFIINPNNEYILPPQYWQEINLNYCSKTHAINGAPLGENVDEMQHIYQALILSLHDYLHKNGFTASVLGLSGGLDSALVAVIAADSLGAENLHCVMMPSEFTSLASLHDAQSLAANLQCQFDIVDIMTCYDLLLQLLKPLFADKPSDITEENLQARIRGTILMSISNKMQKMLLATSNKSESAMGYATLYGDMCGGFALLKDVYKTTIYALANWRNNNIPDNSKFKEKGIIPANILIKEPSAELRFNQKDSDSLPPYALLDQILFAILEDNLESYKIAEHLKIDLKLVKQIKAQLLNSEFKRSQAPIGPKISGKALSSERKYPLTIQSNAYHITQKTKSID